MRRRRPARFPRLRRLTVPRLRMPRQPAPAPRPAAPTAPETVDTSFLETLLGYNARRAALAVIEVFLERMEPFRLKPVDFSVLSVVRHNPGITSRQLCGTLGILPPNLVGLVNTLEKRELVLREPHPRDGRAMALHLTEAGEELMREAEKTAAALEADVASRLSAAELRTLTALLKKVYLPP
jgi:DNA-binding MarR family transcriptional regulator